MKTKRSATLFFSLASLVLAAENFYVDANIGNDGYDGSSPVVKETEGGTTAGPKKTIQAAVDQTRENRGDTVYVAEGEYKEGSSGQYRVSSKAGVKIVATGSRERTFIVGEEDGTGADGCGSKSKKCVYLPAGAWLKGFTVCGGRGTAFNSNTYGGGVWGAGSNSSFVVDCTISNCVSGRAAGARDVTAVRCLFFGNKVCSNGTGSDLMGCLACNCRLAGSASGTRYDVYKSTLRNCTVEGTMRESAAFNCYVKEDKDLNVFDRCVYAKLPDSSTSVFGNESVKSSAYAVDGNARPTNAVLAFDKGDYLNYTNGVPEALAEELGFDYAKGQRVYNGAIDIGCGEYDCRGDFASKIGESGSVTVLSASPGVTAGDGRLCFASGSRADIGISGVDNDARAHVCSFTAATSGQAILHVYRDGESEPAWTVTASGGEMKIVFEGFSGDALRFVLSGDGSATVGGFAKGGNFYVDANIGNDGYDGSSPVVKETEGGATVGPKKTIQAAVDLAQENHGDVVYVAEGEYGEGHYGRYVVYGKAGVDIVATGSRERTFIVGVADDTGTYGCGANSKTCVYLPAGAWLKGFTVCGGRGTAFNNDTYGAGVCGAGADLSFVVDCTISNCVSGRAAGARNVTAVRCRFHGNRVNTTGTHLQSVNAYNCYLHGSLSEGKYDAYSSVLRNCTVMGSARDTDAFNSHVTDDKGNNIFNRCVYAKSTSQQPTVFENGCVQSGSFAVDGDARPANAALAFDKGDFLNYTNGVAEAVTEELKLDYAKGQRVYNGAIDIGCGEYDCRADFSAAIDPRGRIKVAEAGANVVSAADGSLLMDSDSVLETEWNLRYGCWCSFSASVGGDGEMQVFVDGEEVEAIGGTCRFKTTSAGKHRVKIVFAGSGTAALSMFRRGGMGTVISVK